MSDQNTEFTNMLKNKKDIPIEELIRLANNDPSKQPKRIRSNLDKKKIENMVTKVNDMITKQ